MARAYREQEDDVSYLDMGFDGRLSLLVDAGWDSRRIKERTRLLRSANLGAQGANIADIRYDADRKPDREKAEELSRCNWIRDRPDIIITGSTGTGKSYLACALGASACMNSYSVRYMRLPNLLDELALARETGDVKKWQKRYLRCDLLIVDDWLLVKLDEREAREVLEIVESRHSVRSTILCSQYAPGGWHSKLGEGAIADAVIDRLVYNSHIIHIEGDESMRKRTSML